MLRIGTVEPLVPIRPAQDEIGRFELRQFILNRSQGEKTQSRQLARIKLLPAIGEQQPQDLRPDRWEQAVEQRLFHGHIKI